MKLENIVKAGIFSALVAASNDAYAQEAKTATPQEIIDVTKINDNATDVDVDNKDDWNQQKKLIEGGYATVLIQSVEDKPGLCVMGLNGFPQIYDKDYKDARAASDNIIEPEERILNLAEQNRENRFYFPCDRKAETPKQNPPTPTTPTTPITPIVPGPVPKPVPEISKKLPFLIFSPGASYIQIWGAEDATYDNSGILHGASLSLTVQPSFTNWYFGGRFSGYGNASSTSVDIDVPATEGPLAGQLVMKGKNDYSLENFGIGAGSIVGYMIPIDKKGRWGIGLELEHGIMHDRATREFMESSAHYINDNLVEGTNISNHSDDADTQIYGYLTPGLRIKFPFVCGTFSSGIRTDLSDVHRMFSAGIAYCPNKE
ncbi:MAG: hypothetical protein Q7S55_01295 [Nanoarchaeota archaeon]|nr:hypothetical protein [Nanoarchaeota archaeon]